MGNFSRDFDWEWSKVNESLAHLSPSASCTSPLIEGKPRSSLPYTKNSVFKALSVFYVLLTFGPANPIADYYLA